MSTTISSKCDGCERSLESFIRTVFAETEDGSTAPIDVVVFKQSVLVAHSIDGKESYDFCNKECVQVWVDQTGKEISIMNDNQPITIKPKPSN